jgi:protein-S-isoprenylcysteine O-methyltransferase Ste14
MATFRVLVRWAVLTSLLAAVLFIAAGSTRIPSLRNYVAVLSALLLFTMVAVDPELARERARPAGRDIDPGSRTASGFLFLVTVIFAALDVGRLHQSDSVPFSWQFAAIGVLAVALILQAAAMIVNPFFSPALRIQAERGHSVITRGAYRFLRHPGYLAMLIALPASAVAIGSWLALIPAVGFGLVIVRRAREEDEFLKRNLSGYIDYTERVRGGLFPRLSVIGAATVALVTLTLAVAGFLYSANTNSTAGLTLSPSPFNEQRSFEDLKQFTDLGPPPPGSDVHDWADLLTHPGLLGAGVDLHNASFDTFEASMPVGKIPMTNVIVKIHGAQPDIIILGGHYDTKRVRMRFVGANDGGSSTAFLIEMAQVLAQRRNRFTYWVVLFDGEEALQSWSTAEGLYGSRHFPQTLTQDELKQIRAMINIAMIGDPKGPFFLLNVLHCALKRCILMREPYQVLWGAPPGPGPAFRTQIEGATERCNKTGSAFIGLLALCFLLGLLSVGLLASLNPASIQRFTEQPTAISRPPRSHHTAHQMPGTTAARMEQLARFAKGRSPSS